MQKLFDDELFDYRVDNKIREINRAMVKLRYTLDEAYDYAEVDDDIAPAVREALGMKPA